MSFSVAQILEWTGGRLANEGAWEGAASPGSVLVTRPAPLAVSKPGEVAFFFAKSYQGELPTAAPSVLITAEPFLKPLEASGLPIWRKAAVVACADPYLAMAVLSGKFAERLSSVAHLPGAARGQAEVHPTAIVHPDAELDDGVVIGPHCVIERGARIGQGTVLYAGCFVGPEAVIGRDCVLFPRVTVYEWTQIGDRVRLHGGVVLGSDGFGYAPRRDGKTVSGHEKIYHLGRVVVGDDVEMGALSCVDRGTFGDTIIEREAKLDNQVHIGHNARVEHGAIICGGTCLAGRARVGRFAYVGGLTGVTNDVHIGDGALVAACALVSKDVAPGSSAVGNPQREHKEHFKVHAMLNRMLSEKRKG